MYIYIVVYILTLLLIKVPCAIGGGVDSITLVQPKDFNPKAGVVEKV